MAALFPCTSGRQHERTCPHESGHHSCDGRCYTQVNLKTGALLFLEGVIACFAYQSLSDPFQEDRLTQTPLFIPISV